MDAHLFLQIAKYCWLVFILAWIVFAFRQKALKTKEDWRERLLYTIPTLIGFVLLFDSDTDYAWLGARFVGDSFVAEILGVIATAAGVAIAIWARWHLGANWSGIVSIRENHELIGTGPYRWIRHPIYTGILLAAAGTALTLGKIRGLLALAIIFISFYVKARKEEKWLTREFGAGFQAHARRTGMFLPRLT